MALRLSRFIPAPLSQAATQLRQQFHQKFHQKQWQSGEGQWGNWRSPNWKLGIGISLSISGAIGIWGIAQLVMLPDLPNCWVIGFANAPASTKLYCGEQLSNRQTPEDLNHAINLVNSIAMDDPVRPEGDRHIERWSKDLMRLAEQEFQAGNLNRAIAIAYKIPNQLPMYAQVEKQVEQWRSTWKKAEEIYEKTEKFISQQKWYEALTTAKKLLFLGNRYWEGEQYDQLVKKLQAERETYDWANGDANKKPAAAGNAIDQFFDGLKNKRNRESIQALDRAENLADDGDIESLQAAIEAAEDVAFGSANYEKAQDRIETWQTQIERKQDLPQLQEAKQLARQGDVESLQQAIDTANEIGAGRELSDEAEDLSDEWRDRLNELESERRSQQLEQLTNGNNSLLDPVVPATTAPNPTQPLSPNSPSTNSPSTNTPSTNTPSTNSPSTSDTNDGLSAPVEVAPRSHTEVAPVRTEETPTVPLETSAERTVSPAVPRP
jgi:hypothetical protein